MFDKYNIVDEIKRHGKFVISAEQIKEFREPRLMTKFDHKINLPKVFSENELAILPITRGDYVISSFLAYKNFEQPTENIIRVSIPANIQSLMPQFLTSEAIALNCANACGILRDFLGDDELLPTVSGRMSSGEFDFNIDTKNGMTLLQVNNSQIEIDAAYEGINFLSLFEAKRNVADDFLIRQLYYPFRTWAGRVTKPIKSVFLVFSNGIFNLYQYCFDDVLNYNSLYLVKQKNYIIGTDISLFDIETLLKTVSTEREPEVPFPQANSMARVLSLIELLNEKSMTKEELTMQYAFDPRQTNYYTDAGRYLGLIEKAQIDGKVVFSLSALGRSIMAMGYKERQISIVTQILKHKVFSEILRLHLQYGKMPDTNTLVRIMRESGLYHVGATSTYKRRSSTIVGWINWILSLIDNIDS